MAFTTNALDFANVDALLKAAELLEGTLNRGFPGGIEKVGSDIDIPMNVYALNHEPPLGNPRSTNGKLDCLSKLIYKSHSASPNADDQKHPRLKPEDASAPPILWTKNNSAAMEQLGRTLSASFSNAEAHLPLHGINAGWVDSTVLVDRNGSSSLDQLVSLKRDHIFTTAPEVRYKTRSGKQLNPLEDSPEESSNISEVDDSCLDNSSQDSFTSNHGLHIILQDSKFQRFKDSSPISCDRIQPSAAVSTPNTSHCRLRTALLNSPGRLQSLQNRSSNIISSRSHLTQSSLSACGTEKSPEVSRTLVISRQTDHKIKTSPTKDLISKSGRTSSPSRLGNSQSWGSASNLVELTKVHRPSTLSTSPAIVSVTSNSHLSITRPPSAAPVLRRMSSDSSVERTFLSQKSASQPHSPEYRPGRASLPISPCRLPMKKRKLDWEQVASDTFVKKTGSSHHPVLEQTVTTTTAEGHNGCGSLTVSNPLVIDCPLDAVVSPVESYSYGMKKPSVPLSAPPSIPPLARENTSITDDEDSVERRPRSIPSNISVHSITLPTERITNCLTGDRDNTVNTLLTGSVLKDTLDHLTGALSNQPTKLLRTPSVTGSNKFNGCKSPTYAHLSSLMRTYTASAIAPSATSTVPPISQFQSNTNPLSCSKFESEPAPATLNGEMLSSPDNQYVHVATCKGYDSILLHGNSLSETKAASVAIPVLFSNRSISQCSDTKNGIGGSESKQQYNQMNGTHKLFQESEYLSILPENNATRQSLKLKKWLVNGLNSLVTDLREPTAPPSENTVDARSTASNPNEHSFQSQKEIPPNGAAFHRSQSEPLHQPTLNLKSAEHALKTSSVGSLEEARNLPPSKLVIDSLHAPHVSDTTTCRPTSTTSTMSLYTDPGAQILMMLSPSEQDKSTSSNLDPSLAQVLHTSLGGKSAKRFPLLLVSASSSASAAALAAAAAMASGAPPTSLVPVPVQVRTYVPTECDKAAGDKISDPLRPVKSDLNCRENEKTFASKNQRLILSFCTPNNETTGTALDQRLSSLLSNSSSALSNASSAKTPFDKNKVQSDLAMPSDTTYLPLVQPTAIAHSN